MSVPEDLTRARILDAAFACAERHGLARTTITDVSKQARLSRQTVYRYFQNKHDLWFALVLREEERIIATVREAIEPHPDLRPALEAAFLTTLRWLRSHPLLDQVMASEPAELLPFLTVEASPMFGLAMRLMDDVFAARAQTASPILIHRASETCARLFISYAITVPADDAEEVAETLAELLCFGLTKPPGRDR
ncbi:MAG TPA: TetR/AcrR family transcriptional regulator [Actinomycetota bacterium]